MEMTSREKQLKRIDQLRERLTLAKNRLVTADRKQRNSELVVWGVYIEEFYRHADPEGRSRLEESLKKYLTGRNLARAMRGFERVKNETEFQTLDSTKPNDVTLKAMRETHEGNLTGYNSVQDAMNALHAE